MPYVRYRSSGSHTSRGARWWLFGFACGVFVALLIDALSI